jgi:hypothetical protein
MFKLIKKAYTHHLDGLVEKYWQIYKFDMSPNHTSYNNEGDAFKHCIWQAELTFWLGKDIAKFFGDLHEAKPSNPDKEKIMDLHNNEWGRIIGDSYRLFKNYFRLKFVYDAIADEIMLCMENGELITKC